jgi:hypothetical protein
MGWSELFLRQRKTGKHLKLLICGENDPFNEFVYFEETFAYWISPGKTYPNNFFIEYKEKFLNDPTLASIANELDFENFQSNFIFTF